MAEVKLVGTPRTEFGKGAARRLRRDNFVPVVMYELGEEPTHVALPAHEMMLALRQANVLFNIAVDGKNQLAVTKAVQRDAVRQIIEHVDMLKVRAGEKITVDVPIVIIGELPEGVIHLLEMQQISLRAEATHLPQSLEVDITDLEEGHVIHAGDLVLPVGSVLESDPELAVVHITVPKEEVEEEPETTEAEEGEESEAAEGEEGESAEAEAEAAE
ncbi:MAG: 50S ribosomal protein L25/general stress protein Ctc [Cellulomonadaceae bacterium]|jgi:large subunit ribosomal protein L25|nr:50S ribosomal protein L25/general stress protein Ctc [Cellulomonadaceae bacterium]